MQRTKRLMIYLFVYLISSFIFIFFTSLKPQKEKYGGILILGLSPNPNHTLNPFLKLRLDRAIELYQDDYSATIIVTGASKDKEKSEAQLMEDYLVKKGIPKNAIIKEENALSTEQNILFSKNILDTFKINSSLFITSNHHIPRTKFLCKKFGMTNFEVINGKNNFLSVIGYIPLRIWEQTKFNKKKFPK